jgi:hypothetical protein
MAQIATIITMGMAIFSERLNPRPDLLERLLFLEPKELILVPGKENSGLNIT